MVENGSSVREAKRSSSVLLPLSVTLLTIAMVLAAFVPLAECPRCAAMSRDPFLRDGGPMKIEDVEHCRYCSDRGRVTLYKRWIWDGRYGSQ